MKTGADDPNGNLGLTINMDGESLSVAQRAARASRLSQYDRYDEVAP